MGRYARVLVAFDGSISSRNALQQAFKLIGPDGCSIIVVSVAPPHRGVRDLVVEGDVVSSLRQPCEEALREAERIAEESRVRIRSVCEQGQPYARIVDLADAEDCDLIVMGRRGLRRLERVFVGSVTARVIGHTQRDVLVVPRGAVLGWNRLLLATDGSRYSATATAKAIDLAREYGGELVVACAVDLPAELYAEAPKFFEEQVGKARETSEAVTRQAEAAGVRAETHVGECEADTAIVTLAKDRKADLIVMGTHGRTGLRRLLMGSVTEKVIGAAACPVLVVRSH
jgi:nucleotide-binding universal stress UspA family protein